MTQSNPLPGSLTDEESARERAMGEVSDVLLNLDHALARARKGLKVVKRDDVDRNAELALVDIIEALERLRKRLLHDTYYSEDKVRLL